MVLALNTQALFLEGNQSLEHLNLLQEGDLIITHNKVDQMNINKKIRDQFLSINQRMETF